MRHLAILTVALLILLASPAPSVAQTAEEQAQLDWALERGRLLFEMDRAAWVGTDDMMARIPDPAGAGLRGYVVERDGEAFVVTFFGGPAEAPVAHYQARVENRQVVGAEVYAASARPPLTALQRRLAAARQTAGLDRQPCGRAPFNTAVIPPETPDGTIDLYLLTAQVAVGEFPLGGHYRFTIGADNGVVSSREFTRTCLLIPVTQGGPPDAELAAMGVTHLLDPIPTEIHVFTALTSGLPVAVGTNSPDRTWWVTGESIELMEAGSAFAPPRSEAMSSSGEKGN